MGLAASFRHRGGLGQVLLDVENVSGAVLRPRHEVRGAVHTILPVAVVRLRDVLEFPLQFMDTGAEFFDDRPRVKFGVLLPLALEAKSHLWSAVLAAFHFTPSARLRLDSLSGCAGSLRS